MKYLLLLLVTALIAIASTPLTRYLLREFFTKGDSDWIGYAGNIIGGVLGGVCTLLGVGYAFNLERQKVFRESIPNKIMALQTLKKEISNHNFSRNHSISSNRNDTVRNIKLFSNELESFSKKESEFMELAAQVDTDTYVTVDRYYKSINIIKDKIEVCIEEISLRSTDEINIEIAEATQFHISLLEIFRDIIEQKKEKYITDLHKKKESKEIIRKFNDHKYLKSFLMRNRR